MYRRKYQKGKETPDPTGTTQGEITPGDRVSNPSQQEMIKYQAGQGGRPSGREGLTPSPEQSGRLTKAAVINRLMNSKDQQMQMQQAMQKQQMMEQMKLMEVRNQMLQQQNQLLNTKMQKQDMIDQARTIPSNLQKAITSPKRKGGSNSPKRRGKTVVISSSMGGVMKKGGQCGLPGGRNDRKR